MIFLLTEIGGSYEINTDLRIDPNSISYPDLVSNKIWHTCTYAVTDPEFAQSTCQIPLKRLET